MWLKKLHTLYVSRENFESILDTSIQIIHNRTGKKIDQNDTLFFEIFNTIASQVFSIESKTPVLQKHSAEQALQIINGIVIEELVNYILNKKPSLLKQKEPTVIEKKEKEPTVIEKKEKEPSVPEEQTIKLSIENTMSKFNSPIDNITKITVDSLYMYTQDYLITELNNTLVIIGENEEFTVKITPGNYTFHTLVSELNSSIFQAMCTDINFTISDIDHTLVSNTTIEINKDLSTLDTILGIGTRSPLKLIKRNKLQLGIEFGFENEINNFEYNIPLIINSSETITGPVLKEFKLNYTKNFRQPVDLTDIKIDFDNYNHRGYPFYLMVNITHFV